LEILLIPLTAINNSNQMIIGQKTQFSIS